MTSFRHLVAKDRLEKVLDQIPSPCFVLDENLLQENLNILQSVQEKSGATILLALKGFALWKSFPQIAQVLGGVSASSAHEARLGREEFGGEVCSFGAAYSDAEFQELAQYSDHILFNSFWQFEKFRGKMGKIESGLRVNPGYAEVEIDAYNPCIAGSRLGIPRTSFDPKSAESADGLHFHALCGQGAETLERVAEHFEKNFWEFLHGKKGLNMGGGHYITEPKYNLDLLVNIVRYFSEKYGVRVYLEPGEGVVLDSGYLVSTVLDTGENGMPIAILDASAQAHVPDIVGSGHRYRPDIIGASKEPNHQPHRWRLGGPTCLAGDVFGDYSFDMPLVRGQKLIFRDMMQYNMVQTTAFNGVKTPSIAILRKEGNLEIVRKFGYEDYKNRLS